MPNDKNLGYKKMTSFKFNQQIVNMIDWILYESSEGFDSRSEVVKDCVRRRFDELQELKKKD